MDRIFTTFYIASMSIQASIEIRAMPEQVFQLYQTAEAWPEWDPEVRSASLPGGLKVGATGWLQPKSGPKSKIEIVEVTPGRSFTVQSRLPLCRMVFGHKLEPRDDTTVATHWVEFSGPLSPVFERLVGRAIGATLPHTMQGLKRFSEAGAGIA